MERRVTLIKVRRTSDPDINTALQWLGTSLGLFGQRDKDSSCFRIFITLVKSPSQPRSSDVIAEVLTLSRGTVVHHLHKLEDAGLVVREKEGYILKEHSLQKVIERMQQDALNIFSNLQEVAKEIDGKLR